MKNEGFGKTRFEFTSFSIATGRHDRDGPIISGLYDNKESNSRARSAGIDPSRRRIVQKKWFVLPSERIDRYLSTT